MFDCKELNKVADALDEKGILWQNKSSHSTERIHFKVGGIIVSVINGPHTYGGEAGMLETMPPTTVHPGASGYSLFEWAKDVEGWLSADEVINFWINEDL